MSDQKNNQELQMPFGAALFCMLFLLGSMVASMLWLDIPIHIDLLLSIGVTLLVAYLCNGHQWKPLSDAIDYGGKICIQPTIIMMTIGCVVASWIACGTVPMIIYWGLKIISPSVFLATACIACMLTSLATNYNRRNKNVRLYEMGNIYLPKSLPLTELPDERMQFTLGMYGDGDFFSMKGVVEEFLDKIGMHEKEVYDPNAGKSFLHPGRQANIVYDGTVIGYMGEVHPTVAANYGIGDRAYVAVLDMPSIVEKATFDRKYEGIAKFPAVTRDISMVLPKEILVGQVEEIIVTRGGKILENYELFDIYEGSQIKEGFKSVAYSLSFRAKDHTLTDAEITSAMKKILDGLKALGAELRQ